MNNQEEIYKKAKERIHQLRAFYTHFTVFLVIAIPSLIIGWILSKAVFHSFLIGYAGWGLGVLIHAIVTFEIFNFWGKDWEDRKLKEIIQKENQNA
ncbi:hypothetical protein BST97_01855 [Nonlabens spongiae]|uniref:2TM domain-containing protein n=1 Tax=Nonlabens spongiae TaxID=331648 RepID=A0A1W6MGZ5_9FLAO|nr:2TM domain-containing protein [Nonlabens spongiae]ARN76842.1 hypothetical protein BST97_01855 [Nonlabens spongiae]